MDKFIVEEENEDENDNSTLVFSTVQRHPRANLVTFMLWFATLISFIDRYSLSGVLSEGKGQNYFCTEGSPIMEMCISEIYFQCDNISVQILHVFRYKFRTFSPGISCNPKQVKLYFDVGNTEVAVLQTVFVISYIVFAPIIGYFGDRLNRKWILIFGILLQVASVLAGSFVGGNFNQLLGTRVLLGIAECILNVVCFPYVSDLYPASSRSMAIQVIF